MFGLGPRNSQIRSLRLVLLVAVLAAGAAFHHTGTAYTAIRIVYYAVILSGIGFLIYRRVVGRRQGTTAVTDLPGSPPAGSLPPPAGPGSTPTMQSAGWYPDQQNMSVERYWDGSAWTSTRTWDGATWVPTDGGGGPAVPPPVTPPA